MTWFNVNGVCPRRERCLRIPARYLMEHGPLRTRLDVTVAMFERSSPTRDLVIADLVAVLHEITLQVPKHSLAVAFSYRPSLGGFELFYAHPSFEPVPEGAECPVSVLLVEEGRSAL